jgi:hypothetical protein
MLCGGITTQESTMHDRIWFEVGWDYASYGLTLPEDVDNLALKNGFREGRERFRKPVRPHDRFIRKWLRLRLNAVKRGRHFDADVSPLFFLRSIATPVCPITREKLTYGTLTDTDWSIDRLINDGGYSRNNLAMMSVRANNAKDKMTIEEIVDQCIAEDKCNPVLKPIEWNRLYSLCSGVHIATGYYNVEREEEIILGQYIVPMILDFPNHLPISPFQLMQRIITYYWADRTWQTRSPLIADRRILERDYLRLKNLFNAEGAKILQKIGRQIGKDLVFIGAPEKLLWTGKTFPLIRQLMGHMRREPDDSWLTCGSLQNERHDTFVQDFHLKTKGFIQ